MIRYLRLLRAAWRLADAEYDLARLRDELDGALIPLSVTDELAAPIERRVVAARAAYVALRRWHA